MNQHAFFILTPPSEWKEGLLLGNGRLGVNLCGQPKKERFALNHEWLYTGRFRDRTLIAPPAHALHDVRALLDAGNFVEATRLANQSFSPTGGRSPTAPQQRIDPYQPAGDLWITDLGGGDVQSYRRTLSLADACASVSYTRSGVTIRKRVFCRYPSGAVYTELTASGGTLDCDIFLSRIADPHCDLSVSAHQTDEAGLLTMDGRFDGGVAFTVRAAVFSDGVCEALGDRLHLTGTDRAVIVLNIGTSAAGKDPVAGSRSALGRAGF